MTTLISLFSTISLFSSAFADPGMIEVSEQSDSSIQNVQIIQPGDTLWNIANTYYGSPDQWPSLWSFNETITNPHWIYPGNRIIFSLGSILDLPQVDLISDDGQYTIPANSFEKSESACGPDVHFDFKQNVGMFIVSSFLKDPNMLEVLGVVEKSPHNHSMLSDHDLIYIKVENKEDYNCGDVLTVFRKKKDRVKHPDAGFFSSSSYGSMYSIQGEVVVVYTPEAGDYVTAQIRETWGEIERGDLVSARMDVVIQSEVQIPQGQTNAMIIERSSEEHTINTNNHIMFIDKGSNDNVQKGDTFYVVRRRDEYLRGSKEDPLLPASVIGRVMVVDVQETSSSIIITDSRQSIGVGDHLSQNLD
jgi:hypothetical protein